MIAKADTKLATLRRHAQIERERIALIEGKLTRERDEHEWEEFRSSALLRDILDPQLDNRKDLAADAAREHRRDVRAMFGGWQNPCLITPGMLERLKAQRGVS